MAAAERVPRSPVFATGKGGPAPGDRDAQPPGPGGMVLSLRSGPADIEFRLVDAPRSSGEVTERPKVRHWKCRVGVKPHQGFESLPLRFFRRHIQHSIARV